MSGTSVSSTLDIVLKDDVSANARKVAESLERLQAEAKGVDEALAKSGTQSGLQARLKSLGATKEQVEGAAKAWADYAKAEGLALDKRGDWTAKQAAGVKNWENVTVASLRAMRGAERAKALADEADARRAEERRERENKKRVEDAARAAEAEVKEHRRLAEVAARDERQRRERDERDRRLSAERDVREQRQRSEAQHRHEEQLVHQRQHAMERQGFTHFALTSAAMAVSAHEVAHVGSEAWREGAELQHERLGLANAGRTPEEMREIEAAARRTVGSLPTGGMVESMKVIAETTSAFGSVEHAIGNLPFMMKAMSVLKAAGGEHIQGDAGTVGRYFAKTFEERQTRPEDFESEAREMIPAMVASGGVFNPQELYAFAQQAKSSLPALSMRFLSRIAPSIIGANGGDRAGTALNAFESVISGKANDKKQAEQWLKLGLLDPSKVIMKAGHATSWQSGAVKDTFLAMTDPLAWSEKYLIPALQKQGIDTNSREAVKMILDTMFRNQNANLFASEITQEASRARLHKDEGLYNQAGSLEQIYERNLADFGVASGALATALRNLAAAATAPLMGTAASALNGLAGVLNHLAQWGFQHPTIAAGTGIVAGGAAMAGAGWLSYQFMNGFGLGTSAKALDAAAAHLMQVGGGTGWGAKGGAAATAAAEGAGQAALAIPGAVEAAAGIAAFGGAFALTGLVKEAMEAQQPGQGGQWAKPTPGTEDLDRKRLEDQEARAADLEHQIHMNEVRSKLPGGADAINIPLKDQLAETLNQIAQLKHGLDTLYVSPDREAERGRAMMGLRRPEEFGPPMPWVGHEQFGPPMPLQPAPNVTPTVDPASATDALFTLGSLATETGGKMQTALNVTATPVVDTGSINAAQAAAERLAATLAQIGALAASAASAVAGAAGGAGAALSPRRSMAPAPTGRTTA